MSAEDSLIEANPCKLRNGNWGAKTAEPVEAGDTVQIVTRAGKTWRAEVTTVVWTDGTVCICETASQGSGQNNGQSSGKSSGQGSKQAADKPAKQNSRAKKPAARSRDASNAPVETEAYGTPAYAADTPPTAVDGPSDELDAMADRAADESAEDDADLMAAYEAMADDDTHRE